MNREPGFSSAGVGRPLRLGASALVLACLCACSALAPTASPPPAFYSLAADTPSSATPARRPLTTAAACSAPTLIVNPTHAAPGFDSHRIMYLREPFKLAYFSQSEWVDAPARMLTPLLVARLESSGRFCAVAPSTASASGDLRLDTQIIRLQQEFTGQPSRVRFTLRAYLIEEKTRRVLAWREFDSATPSASEDAHGGVVAANLAVQTVLNDLSQFLKESIP